MKLYLSFPPPLKTEAAVLFASFLSLAMAWILRHCLDVATRCQTIESDIDVKAMFVDCFLFLFVSSESRHFKVRCLRKAGEVQYY